MSRTKKGAKSPGHEYWTARPGNIGGAVPGKPTKRKTHRLERRLNKVKKQDPVE